MESIKNLISKPVAQVKEEKAKENKGKKPVFLGKRKKPKAPTRSIVPQLAEAYTIPKNETAKKWSYKNELRVSPVTTKSTFGIKLLGNQVNPFIENPKLKFEDVFDSYIEASRDGSRVKG